MASDFLQTSLKGWLEENIPAFLTGLNKNMPDYETWEMPMVEDYVLVVAVKDYSDGLGGVFTITDANIPPYRINGLLREALD
jgi:hypothetical protein